MLHPIQVLSGPNFKLIPITAEHISDLYIGWLNDAEINRYLEIRFVPQTRDTVTEYVRSFYMGKEAYMWVIYPNGKDQFVGTTTVQGINRNHDSAGIGLMIGNKEYWGSNCALEVLGLVTDFAFETLGLRRMALETSAPNHSINFTLRRFGFTMEGSMRQASVIGPGEYCDGYRWGVLVDEWRDKYRPGS